MSTAGSKRLAVESADSKREMPQLLGLGLRASGLQPLEIGKIGESFHSYDSNPM